MHKNIKYIFLELNIGVTCFDSTSSLVRFVLTNECVDSTTNACKIPSTKECINEQSLACVVISTTNPNFC
jgi:hypothetical protein